VQPEAVDEDNRRTFWSHHLLLSQRNGAAFRFVECFTIAAGA
jgi:hypothetical protein